jgi:type VI secretion system protein ImpL
MNGTLLAAIIGILVILLIAGIILVVRASLAKATKITVLPGAPAAAVEEPIRKPGDIAPPATLRTALAIAMRELRVLVGGARGPTDMPWSLVIGVGGDDLLPLLPPPTETEYSMGWLDQDDLARAGTVSFRTGGVVLGFEGGLVGQPQAERRLMDLLREVEVIRPDRPLDSLVIAIPWDLLHRGDEAAINLRARQLYNLILAVQQRTGWRVPVYALITGSEQLPGFAAIGRAVLAQAISPVIGWAAPRTLDSVFQPSWVDDAFDAMCGALSIEQLHVLMGIEADQLDAGLPPEANDQLAEEVLLLPARLAAVMPALRLLLSGMLVASVYHEAFMFRGIFLTGDAEPGPEAPGPAAGAEPPVADKPMAMGETPPPALAARAPQRLAQQLFLEKIFPESGLAQPAYGERTRRHRMIRRTQYALAAACLCFVLGIGLIRYYGGHSARPLDALLRNIATIEVAANKNRDETRRAGGNCSGRKARSDQEAARREFALNRRNSVDLLQQMSTLDLHRVEFWLAPTSYFSGANEMVERAIKKSFHDVVFNAIADSMATQAGIEALVAGDDPVENWRAGPGAPDGQGLGDDFEGYWGATVRNVRTYDHHFQLASAMRGKTPEGVGVMRGFSDVVQYSLGEQLPAQFTRNYRVYSEGITETSLPCLDTVIVQNTLDGVIARRYGDAVNIYYRRNPLSQSWENLSKLLYPDPDTEFTDEALRGVLENIDTMSAALAEPRRYTWVFAADGGDLPLPSLAEFQGLQVVYVQNLAELPEKWRGFAEGEQQRLRSAQIYGANLLDLDQGADAKALLAKPMPPTVATVPANAPTGLPKLSQSTIDTRDFLRVLLAQPFMVQVGEPGSANVDPRHGWDVGRLQSVQAAIKGYGDFRNAAHGVMPEELHRIAGDLAAKRFSDYARRLVDEAAQPLPASIGIPGAPDPRTANFSQALPLLVGIRDGLRGIGAEDVAVWLDGRVAEQANLMLEDVEKALRARGGPYAIDANSLQRWDGTGSPALAAYGVDTMDDLKATLPQRRAVVSALARQRAAPLLAYLSTSTKSNPALFARWQGILDTLDAYEANSPNNSLSQLEQYITVDLAALDWRKCALLRTSPGRRDDYFSEQRATIKNRMIGLCKGVARQTVEGKYAGLREFFNSRLAGRFPFSSFVSSPGAEPADVQDFFGQYGTLLPELKAAFERASDLNEEERQIALSAAAVLGQLIDVQTALAPMLDAGDATLTYRVGVDFFPNVPTAVGQSQILDASIGTPDSIARDKGAESFVWHNGEPVAVRLRWAANAPTLPVAPDGKCVPQPGGNVFGQDVGDKWALLRLMRMQGPEPRSGGLVAGVPLAFEVPLCENRARASGGDPVRARALVFLRLALSRTVQAPEKPDRQVPVILPPFPTSVPALAPGATR